MYKTFSVDQHAVGRGTEISVVISGAGSHARCSLPATTAVTFDGSSDRHYRYRCLQSAAASPPDNIVVSYNPRVRNGEAAVLAEIV